MFEWVVEKGEDLYDFTLDTLDDLKDSYRKIGWVRVKVWNKNRQLWKVPPRAALLIMGVLMLVQGFIAVITFGTCYPSLDIAFVLWNERPKSFLERYHEEVAQIVADMNRRGPNEPEEGRQRADVHVVPRDDVH